MYLKSSIPQPYSLAKHISPLLFYYTNRNLSIQIPVHSPKLYCQPVSSTQVVLLHLRFYLIPLSFSSPFQETAVESAPSLATSQHHKASHFMNCSPIRHTVYPLANSRVYLLFCHFPADYFKRFLFALCLQKENKTASSEQILPTMPFYNLYIILYYYFL